MLRAAPVVEEKQLASTKMISNKNETSIPSAGQITSHENPHIKIGQKTQFMMSHKYLEFNCVFVVIYNEKELQALKNTFNSNSDRIVWLAITGMRQNKISPEKIKSEFEGLNFYVPKLMNPLRNSSKIIEFAYPTIRGISKLP